MIFSGHAGEKRNMEGRSSECEPHICHFVIMSIGSFLAWITQEVLMEDTFVKAYSVPYAKYHHDA